MARSLRYFDNDGVTPVSGYNFGNLGASVTTTARKAFVENNGDIAVALTHPITQVGANDGNTRVRTGLDTVTLMPPRGVTAVTGAAGVGGVWGTIGLRYYRITIINATGETQGSVEVSVNVDDVTKKVTLNWVLPVQGTGAKIYRSITPGVYTTPALLPGMPLGAAVTTFLDDGTATVAGALPAANTTAGGSPNYGTPPALSTTPLNLGTLNPGDMEAFWYQVITPASSSEDGNPRRARLAPTE